MWRCTVYISLILRRHAHEPLAERLMHTAHKRENTSGVSKSSSDWLNYTGFPGDVCVACFNVLSGNKDAVTPNSRIEEESRRVYKCDDKCLSGSTKRYEIFKVRDIESLKYVWEFHTLVCYCGDISTPRNVTLNETSCDWLFDMSVKRPHGRGLANDLQPSVWIIHLHHYVCHHTTWHFVLVNGRAVKMAEFFFVLKYDRNSNYIRI